MKDGRPDREEKPKAAPYRWTDPKDIQPRTEEERKRYGFPNGTIFTEE